MGATPGHTDGQIDLLKASAQRANALKIKTKQNICARFGTPPPFLGSTGTERKDNPRVQLGTPPCF